MESTSRTRLPLRFSLRTALLITACIAVAITVWPARDRSGAPELTGKVLDPTGKPISGCEVQLCKTFNRQVVQSTTTEDDGTYRFPEMQTKIDVFQAQSKSYQEARVVMRIQHPDYCPASGEFAWVETVKWSRDSTHYRDIIVRPGITLSGVLVRGGSNELLPDTELQLSTRNGRFVYLESIVTDETGSFRMAGLCPGVYRLHCRAGGEDEPLGAVELTWNKMEQKLVVLASGDGAASP